MSDLSPIARVEIEGSLAALPMPRNPEKPTAQEITAFTSAKLDLINWILRDQRPTMNPTAKNTAIYLLQCVNSTTLQCNPSYQTIADAMGFKNEKTAERAVKAVKACGWIDIRRFNRKKTNRYVFLANTSVAKAIDEYQDHLRDQRKAERVAEQAHLEQTNMSGRTAVEQTFSSPLEQTNMSGKHLKGTPEVIMLNEGEDLSMEGSVPSNGYATKDDDLHIPFPAPSSEKELASTLSTLFAGYALSPLTMSRMRTLLASGRLTPAIVKGQRREDAA
ncbi:helix-turn-helix domain-containing protein [Mesorhizobium australicum]|uniref:helix-turn-helix domain-containing protein n=1 Tax=Mesorhizobium australicum TaxID=536018 RepID=UPI0033390946